MRPVRLADAAVLDVESQIEPNRREDFRRVDLAPALKLLSAPGVWEATARPHGPGRRLTVEGVTVAGFHLFVVPDDVDPRDGALVVFAIDIWLDEFPE